MKPSKRLMDALEANGVTLDWASARSLGGSQPDVWRIRRLSVPGGGMSSGDHIVLKIGMPPAAAVAEGRGLALLEASHAVRVPRVLACGEVPPHIVLEAFVGGPYRSQTLGQAVATLHRSTGPAFGLDHDNFIGRTPQWNAPHQDWGTFFAQQRLAPQLVAARQGGLLSAEVARGLTRVVDRVAEHLAGHQPAPSLVHGDLWSGNVVGSGDGHAALIDPAVYYGDRETDVAFSRLFGGFKPGFYAAYEAEWPLPYGWQDRAELYNLYHLLNHLNLFGSAYLPAVGRIASRLA